MSTNSTAYAVIDTIGVIVRQGMCSAASLALQAGDGETLIQGPLEGISDSTHYWDGSEFVEYPERPGTWAEWDGQQWIDPRTQADFDAIEAAAWSRLRQERDQYLRDSDWTQLSDCPLAESKCTEWQDYRQVLRDLPANTTDPHNPVWPAPPEA